MSLETQSAVERLNAFRERLRNIQDLVRGRPSHSDTSEAQYLFRQLKQDLESEYRRMATVRGGKLTETDQLFYWPAIQDAWANSRISRVRADWRPQKWAHALYEVNFYLGYWLGNLNRAIASKQNPKPPAE